MEDNELVFYALILVPYFIAVAMPGWRWLAVPVALGAAGALWAFWLRPMQAEGLELALDQVLFVIAAIGLAAGTAVRMLTLFLRTHRVHDWISWLITAAGAVAVSVVFRLLT